MSDDGLLYITSKGLEKLKDGGTTALYSYNEKINEECGDEDLDKYQPVIELGGDLSSVLYEVKVRDDE